MKSLRRTLSSLPNPLIGVMLLWFASMMSVPILRWTFGDVAILWGVYMTTLIQASVVVTVLVLDWGWKRTLLSVSMVIVGTILAEIIGTKTGIPFGDYHYTESLQPQIEGVPVLIGFAWLMLLPITWGIAYATPIRNRFAIALYAGVAMTAWDLYLDPQMVGWNLWVWDQVGSLHYFGIPLQNFVGWFLVATAITWIVNPPSLTPFPCLLVYGCVWILQFIGQFVFWGQMLVAVFGFIGMGSILLLTMVLSSQRKATRQ